MISFERNENGPELYLVYTPENNDGEWLKHQLTTLGKASLSGKIFDVTKERWLAPEESEEELDDPTFVFEIGVVSASFYCIEPEVLGINFDLGIHVGINLERKIFAAERNISVFRRFNDFGLQSLTVGGGGEDALPKEVFFQLLREFPNSYELTRYAKARISSIVRNYLPMAEDERTIYEKYLNKKQSHKGFQPLLAIAPYESEKFNDLVEKMEVMLADSESYTESQWQHEILQVILLLFPRYIKAFTEGPVNDSWANKKRRVDFLLVDASGYIDVIEIKKPFDQKLVT